MGIFKNLLGTVLDQFMLGRGNASDKYLYANIRTTDRPGLRWNNSDTRWEYSNDGVIWSIIGSGSGGGGLEYGVVPIAINETTDQATDIVVGALGLTGAALGTATVHFAVTGYVANSSLTGVVTLYNLTDSTTEATLSFTELLSTKKISAALTLDSGAKVYEVRMHVTGGAVPADVVACMWAGFELTLTS